MSLFSGIFKHISLTSAVLPYNLNWIKKDWSIVAEFCDKNPITVFDVGARDGGVEELVGLEKMICYFGFDADKDECERLNKMSHPWHEYKCFPYFIGEKNETISFNLYKSPGQSSIFLPHERFRKEWGGEDFDIDRSVEVESTILESLIKKENIKSPDFLKLDTQGSELSILKSSKELLRDVSLIECEVEFVEAYQGQPLYHDIASFLYDNGFELLYLNRHLQSRRNKYQSFSRGQVIFGDALFVRSERFLSDFSLEKIIKLIILLIQYGHIDHAYTLLMQFPKVKEIFPNIQKVFPSLPISSGSSIVNKIFRAIFFQIDKLICLALYLRKHNRRDIESDRSWPIR